MLLLLVIATGLNFSGNDNTISHMDYLLDNMQVGSQQRQQSYIDTQCSKNGTTVQQQMFGLWPNSPTT